MEKTSKAAVRHINTKKTKKLPFILDVPIISRDALVCPLPESVTTSFKQLNNTSLIQKVTGIPVSVLLDKNIIDNIYLMSLYARIGKKELLVKKEVQKLWLMEAIMHTNVPYQIFIVGEDSLVSATILGVRLFSYYASISEDAKNLWFRSTAFTKLTYQDDDATNVAITGKFTSDADKANVLSLIRAKYENARTIFLLKREDMDVIPELVDNATIVFKVVDRNLSDSSRKKPEIDRLISKL